MANIVEMKDRMEFYEKVDDLLRRVVEVLDRDKDIEAYAIDLPALVEKCKSLEVEAWNKYARLKECLWMEEDGVKENQ